MPLISNFLAIIGLLVAFTVGVAPSFARAEQRIALVLGNAAYETGALKTTANDAGLIAQNGQLGRAEEERRVLAFLDRVLVCGVFRD